MNLHCFSTLIFRIGDYYKASIYYEKRIEALDVIHGPNSIELCSALPNYSRVLEAK